MEDRTLRGIEKRFLEIERNMVRLRRGVISATEPLSVELGGSEVAYKGVPYLGSEPELGDGVAVLMSGHNLLVLGKLQN